MYFTLPAEQLADSSDSWCLLANWMASCSSRSSLGCKVRARGRSLHSASATFQTNSVNPAVIAGVRCS